MKLVLGFLGLATAASIVSVQAQEGEPQSLWDRPTLLGGPGSIKDALSQSGVDLTGWITLAPEWGRENASENGLFGGRFTGGAKIDGGAFWDGLSFNFYYEGNFGEDPNVSDDGLLVPSNAVLDFPQIAADDVFTFNVSQTFGTGNALTIGTIDLTPNVQKTPLVGGGGDETFLNAAFAGPVTGILPPYILGAIASFDTAPATFTGIVYDPRIVTDPDVLSDPFSEGVGGSLAATFKTNFGGLPGYYGLRVMGTNAEGLDLASIPAFALLPPESQTVLTKKGYWYANASFQQYLHQDPSDPSKGWGLFGYVSISDGNPNPYKWTAWAGLAGNTPLASRSNDRWGIGYFYYGVSNQLVDGLKELGIGVNDEQGLEAFYNFAVTPWFQISADVQWIDPFTSAQDDAVIGAIRTRVVF